MIIYSVIAFIIGFAVVLLICILTLFEFKKMQDIPFFVYMMYASSVLLITGLITTSINKKNKKIGLLLIISSVIFLILGFGACLNNFKLDNMN